MYKAAGNFFTSLVNIKSNYKIKNYKIKKLFVQVQAYYNLGGYIRSDKIPTLFQVHLATIILHKLSFFKSDIYHRSIIFQLFNNAEL